MIFWCWNSGGRSDRFGKRRWRLDVARFALAEPYLEQICVEQIQGENHQRGDGGRMQIVLVSALLHNDRALLKHRLSRTVSRISFWKICETRPERDKSRSSTESVPIRARDRSITGSLSLKDGEVFWSFKNKVIETSKGALLKVLKWWSPDTYAVREIRWLHIRKNERPMMCFASKCSARSRSLKFRRKRCAI